MPLIKKPTELSPGTERDPQKLIAMLGSELPGQRSFAARRLGDFSDAADPLAEALKRETDKRVREEILTSLATLDTLSGFDAVLPLLRSDDANLRTTALDALRAMPVSGSSRLGALLADVDPDVRILACELARDISSKEASTLLCALIEADPLVNVCAAAIDALAEIGSSENISAIEHCLQRFPHETFLAFAAEVARSRLASRRSR